MESAIAENLPQPFVFESNLIMECSGVRGSACSQLSLKSFGSSNLVTKISLSFVSFLVTALSRGH